MTLTTKKVSQEARPPSDSVAATTQGQGQGSDQGRDVTDERSAAPGPEEAPGQPTDVELFERARAGDSEAVDLVWRRYYPYALRMARRFTRNASDADDLAAEAFTRILALLRRGRGPREHARTYIARTVRNVATDRSRRREPLTVVIDEAHDLPSLHDPAWEAATLIELFETLDCLTECSPRQRYALYMTACEGRPIAQVAEDLGISSNAVAALLVRGREAIRRALVRRTTERAASNRRRARNEY